MKKLVLGAFAALILLSGLQTVSAQQSETNLVHITKLKSLRVENGSPRERDSLIAIYNENVIKKNKYILSHREYSHFFTGDSQDYLIVEEFKDFDSWKLSNEMMEELEKAAWPDEEKREAFMNAMNKYFENWHGDMLMNYNPKLSKN